ncbi:MAG: site-specific integrase [Magnetospirillum sp.]|nr:site-specific integrase [Magnetospirillum sp.]
MATYRKRSGNWQAIVQRGGVWESRTFDTKADAEEWATELERKIRRNEHLDSKEAEETSLLDALDRYLKEIVPGKKGEVQDRRRIAAWKRDELAKKPLAKVRGSDLASWRDKRLAAEVSGGTVRRDLAIISHLFNVAAKEWGMTGLVNPVENIRVPPQGKARDRRLSARPDKKGKTEAVRLLAACKASANPWLAPIVEVALATAMRQSELLALSWDAIDLTRKVARLEDTKNGERRDVPLSSAAVKTLKRVARFTAGFPVAIGKRNIKLRKTIKPGSRRAFPFHAESEGHRLERRIRILDGRVFPVSVGRLNVQWRKAVKTAELGDFHFHDLRHEATSRLFEKGLNPMEAAAVTGHKTLQMLKRYTHLRAEDLAAKLG